MDSIRLNMCGSSNITLLSNDFIDNYMKDANDVQIKLYLYLLRNSGTGRSIDVSELADFFNYPEKDVERALKYWEKKGVLSLGDVAEKTGAADTVAASCEEPIKKDGAFRTDAPVKKTVPTLPDPDTVKAGYTIDMLREFKNSDSTSMLLVALQQYTGRPVGPSRISSLLFMHDALGMDCALIDYLMQYCIERGDESIRNMEEVALSWTEQGVTTVEQAKSLGSAASAAEVKKIMRLLGRNSDPTELELKLINRWVHTYGFEMDIIKEAVERAVCAVGSNRPAYAESILRQWYEKDVHTMEDVRVCDEAFRNTRAAKNAGTAGYGQTGSVSGYAQAGASGYSQAGASGKRSIFCDIEQHDYDFDELTRLLVDNE